jgi:hypothetical protein
VLLEKIIPKDKKLLLEIKSGAKGSEIELFLDGFAKNQELMISIILT